MFLIISILLFLNTFFVLVTSEAPDCGTKNQFRGYCFSFEYCDNFKCSREDCGYFLKSSVSLKIKNTIIVPRCAITSSGSLKSISGINSNIHVLASGSFANLPNLESIRLPYNLIRELHHGIFFNVNAELIDLSWNKIIYISEGAFNGITGLKYLNLSKNELATIPVRYFPNSLVDLNLSHNFLERIALYGNRQPDLASVDISHNNLEHVALSFDNQLKKLDLSNNRLRDIDLYDINDCETLRIPENLFSEVPPFLIDSRIRRLALHPNPWKCDQLQRLWLHLQDNQIEEEKPKDLESQPLCSINSHQKFLQTKTSLGQCEDDGQCAENELCRSHKCSNPCPSACDSTNICEVRYHEIQCVCPGTEKKNPKELFSKCYDVECFSNTDCFFGQFCTFNKTCHVISFEPGSNAPGSNSGYGAAGSTGYASSFSNAGNPYPDAPFREQDLISAQLPGSTSSTVQPPPSSYFSPESFNENSYENEQPSSYPGANPLPWWYNDIPKLAPTNTISRQEMTTAR